MSSISMEELKKLDKSTYQLIDIRGETERSLGAIKEALNIDEENITSDERIDRNKKLIYGCVLLALGTLSVILA